MEQCCRITQELLEHPFSELFVDPVDPVRDSVPDYLDVIKNPMDFTTVNSKLARRAYPNWHEWAADVNLIFDNCVTYNGDDSVLSAIALRMKERFDKLTIPLRILDYGGWAQRAVSLHAKLTDMLRTAPQPFKRVIPQTELVAAGTLSERDYETLAIKLSRMKNGLELGKIVQILSIFGVDVPQTKAKKVEVNIKHIPPQAVMILQAYVREQEHR
jgi:hypothetical protein